MCNFYVFKLLPILLDAKAVWNPLKDVLCHVYNTPLLKTLNRSLFFQIDEMVSEAAFNYVYLFMLTQPLCRKMGSGCACP